MVWRAPIAFAVFMGGPRLSAGDADGAANPAAGPGAGRQTVNLGRDQGGATGKGIGWIVEPRIVTQTIGKQQQQVLIIEKKNLVVI